jgi:hypothetical protein
MVIEVVVDQALCSLALGEAQMLAGHLDEAGTLYATTAQRQQSRAELSKSIEMYRAMDMTLWLPQAEAALAQTGQGEWLARGIS